MHETTAQTIERIIKQADMKPWRELVRTEHYVVDNKPGIDGHGVRFYYDNGDVWDFPPHKLGVG